MLRTGRMALWGFPVNCLRSAALVLVGGLALAAAAQAPAQKPAETPSAGAQAQGQAAPGQKTAAEAFKNIQVLKTVPAEDLQPTMRYISGALGVECNFCHVRDNGQLVPEKDDK